MFSRVASPFVTSLRVSVPSPRDKKKPRARVVRREFARGFARERRVRAAAAVESAYAETCAGIESAFAFMVFAFMVFAFMVFAFAGDEVHRRLLMVASTDCLSCLSVAAASWRAVSRRSASRAPGASRTPGTFVSRFAFAFMVFIVFVVLFDSGISFDAVSTDAVRATDDATMCSASPSRKPATSRSRSASEGNTRPRKMSRWRSRGDARDGRDARASAAMEA